MRVDIHLYWFFTVIDIVLICEFVCDEQEAKENERKKWKKVISNDDTHKQVDTSTTPSYSRTTCMYPNKQSLYLMITFHPNPGAT